MKNHGENPFFRVVHIEDGLSSEQAQVQGYYIPDMIRKGYKYVANGDRYVRSKNKLEIKLGGYGLIGLVAVAVAVLTKFI